MRRDRLIATTSGLLLGLACLLGAGRDESVPSDPVFVATLIDGATAKGRVARLDSSGSLDLEGPAGRALRLWRSRVSSERKASSLPLWGVAVTRITCRA